MDELRREAFGVRGVCSRFRNALRLTTAPASWTHSKRFARHFTVRNPRSLPRSSTIAQSQTSLGQPNQPNPARFAFGGQVSYVGPFK